MMSLIKVITLLIIGSSKLYGQELMGWQNFCKSSQGMSDFCYEVSFGEELFNTEENEPCIQTLSCMVLIKGQLDPNGDPNKYQVIVWTNMMVVELFFSRVPIVTDAQNLIGLIASKSGVGKSFFRTKGRLQGSDYPLTTDHGIYPKGVPEVSRGDPSEPKPIVFETNAETIFYSAGGISSPEINLMRDDPLFLQIQAKAGSNYYNVEIQARGHPNGIVSRGFGNSGILDGIPPIEEVADDSPDIIPPVPHRSIDHQNINSNDQWPNRPNINRGPEGQSASASSAPLKVATALLINLFWMILSLMINYDST